MKTETWIQPLFVCRFQALVILLLLFSTNRVPAQDTVFDESAISRIRVTLGIYAGRPNPTLWIENLGEIDAIVEALFDTTLGREMDEKAKAALRRPGYQGVVVDLESANNEDRKSYRIINGTICNRNTKKCFEDRHRLEAYLVDKILNSNETKDNTLLPELEDQIRKGVQAAD